MILTVYKGFSVEFLEGIEGTPLLDNDITSKLNVLAFDKKYRKQLDMSLLSLEEDDDVQDVYHHWDE